MAEMNPSLFPGVPSRKSDFGEPRAGHHHRPSASTLFPGIRWCGLAAWHVSHVVAVDNQNVGGLIWALREIAFPRQDYGRWKQQGKRGSQGNKTIWISL
jgi:hypothetical protein